MSVGDLVQFRMLAALFLSTLLAVSQYGSDEYPNIGEIIESLEEWESGKAIEGFHDGELLVLDFFAYWCIPCVGVSIELSGFESDSRVDQVRVLPINVESRNSTKTNAFMKRTGLERAYSDVGGKLSTILGVQSLPFVAVVKVNVGETASSFEVIEKYDTFPGVEKLESRLREVRMAENETEIFVQQIPENISTQAVRIEAITVARSDINIPSTSSAQLKPVESEFEPNRTIDDSNSIPLVVEVAKPNKAVSPSVLQNGSLGEFSSRFTFESMESSDVEISNTAIEAKADLGGAVGTLSLSRNSNGLQYTPSSSDLVGVESDRREDSYQLGVDGEIGLSDRSSMLVTLGAYEGFTDYRSIWLDEFYRQQFEPVIGYLAADPQGYSVSIGGRHIYMPATAVLDLTIGFQRDRIAPAYEAIPFEPLTRGRSEIETKVIRIASENLVSRRVRIKQQIQFTDTTDRSLRVSYLVESRMAIGEFFVGKASIATTKETSNFVSRHIGLSLEKEIGKGLNVSFYGRRYSDDGEIVDPLILSTASPSLGTTQMGTGIAWQGEQSSFSLSYGRYETEYETLPAISFQFENLYANRNWDFLRISASINF